MQEKNSAVGLIEELLDEHRARALQLPLGHRASTLRRIDDALRVVRTDFHDYEFLRSRLSLIGRAELAIREFQKQHGADVVPKLAVISRKADVSYGTAQLARKRALGGK